MRIKLLGLTTNDHDDKVGLTASSQAASDTMVEAGRTNETITSAGWAWTAPGLTN
jgi:hypothetical protein